MKLSIVIPVYNEKNYIMQLVKKIEGVDLANWEKEIVMVEDCSTDGTRELLQEYKDKYKIIFHEKNQGKGAALHTGFAAATGDYVLVQDADLEYNPEEYTKLLEPVEKYDADVVYGSRFVGGEPHRILFFWHTLGNKLLTFFSNIFTDLNLTDMETCYKLVKKSVLSKLTLEQKRFGFDPEITAKIARVKDVKIFEVGISYNGRTYAEGKKINWKDGFRVIYCILKYGIPGTKEKSKAIYTLLFLLGGVNLILFHQLFGFHFNNDTDSFLWMIEWWRGMDVPLHPNRYLNPFYALVGYYIFPFLPAAKSLIMTNIIFYFGLIGLTYGLVYRVFKDKFVAFFSALFIMTAYPMLRYGLTQVQDMGGYFWFLLTVYGGWRWWKEKSMNWFLLASVSVAFGMLTKESGAMGAMFVGMLLLLDKNKLFDKVKNFLIFSILPFITLVSNQIRGKDLNVSSKEWFLWNWKTYGDSHFTFFHWVGVNSTTYNFLWIFFLFALFILFKNRKNINKDIKIYLLAILPASLSYFSWPIFIGRTVFISAWFFVPIAAYAMKWIFDKGGKFRVLVIASVVMALVMPYLLQSVLRYGHVFSIINECNRNIPCVWDTFWDNRHTFSKIM